MARGLPPVRKSLGQHFLNDRRILTRIVDALEISDGETVIEIGPGRGSLTELLVPRARRLVLIEYDRALAAILRERYADIKSVEVIEADVLSVPLGNIANERYKLVGNVPYYITTPILFHALERPRPERAVYLVQREVAERMVAKPGSKEYGALSVNVQALAIPKQLFRVAPGSFQPPPKVESAVVSVEPRVEAVVSEAEEGAFKKLVLDSFGMRRKQMRRVLRSLFRLSAERADEVLTATGIDPEARPETLAPIDFAKILRGLNPQLGQAPRG